MSTFGRTETTDEHRWVPPFRTASFSERTAPSLSRFPRLTLRGSSALLWA